MTCDVPKRTIRGSTILAYLFHCHFSPRNSQRSHILVLMIAILRSWRIWSSPAKSSCSDVISGSEQPLPTPSRAGGRSALVRLRKDLPPETRVTPHRTWRSLAPLLATLGPVPRHHWPFSSSAAPPLAAPWHHCSQRRLAGFLHDNTEGKCVPL